MGGAVSHKCSICSHVLQFCQLKVTSGWSLGLHHTPHGISSTVFLQRHHEMPQSMCNLLLPVPSLGLSTPGQGTPGHPVLPPKTVDSPSPRILTRKVWTVSTFTHIFQALKLPVSQSLLVYPALSKSRLRAKLTSPSSPQRRTLVSPSHSSYKVKI